MKPKFKANIIVMWGKRDFIERLYTLVHYLKRPWRAFMKTNLFVYKSTRFCFFNTNCLSSFPSSIAYIYINKRSFINNLQCTYTICTHHSQICFYIRLKKAHSRYSNILACKLKLSCYITWKKIITLAFGRHFNYSKLGELINCRRAAKNRI